MSAPGADALHDCLIVGAGPAGLTAATCLARYRRDIVVVDAGDELLAKLRTIVYLLKGRLDLPASPFAHAIA